MVDKHLIPLFPLFMPLLPSATVCSSSRVNPQTELKTETSSILSTLTNNKQTEVVVMTVLTLLEMCFSSALSQPRAPHLQQHQLKSWLKEK